MPLPDGFPYTANVGRAGRRASTFSRQPWDKARKDQLSELWLADAPVEEIADQCETSRGAVYQWVRKLGLPPRRERRIHKRPSRRLVSDKTGQRRFTGLEHSEDSRRVKLKPWHPALRNGSTIYGQMVIPAALEPNILKSGEWNRKIGAMATKGRWKGSPIFTLTLEERATCPRSCLEWATCYGNNLGKSPRIIDDGTLELRLRAQLAHLNALHLGGFIVRLHILGDFYSLDYVETWRRYLSDFPALRVFGFTARQPADPIGRAVLELMADFEERVLIRVSGAGLELLCSEVVDKAEEATGIICPAQLDAERSCATCGLCWSSDRTITFLRH
jgi:hypothetical protein